MDLGAYLDAARAFDEGFRARWEPVGPAPASEVDAARLAAAWAEYTGRLQDNYPFFHPRYAGQMLPRPHPVAMAGYLAAMTVNPNNHALDGGLATGPMEKEAVARPGGDVRPPGRHPRPPDDQRLDRQPGGALVARQLRPGPAVADSAGRPLHPRPHVRGAGGRGVPVRR